MTVSDGSDAGQVQNQQEGDVAGDGTTAGGDQEPDIMDKVTAVLRDTVGVNLDEIKRQAAEDAAATARKEAGRKAQETYDPKIDALEKQLKQAVADLDKTRKDVRLAEIAKMPPEKQEAARKLLEAETTVNEMVRMRQNLNEAAKAVAAEKAAVSLQREGITAEAEDFLDCDTPADMNAKAERLRVDELKRQLEEAKGRMAGKDKDEGEHESDTKRQPPQASQRSAPKTGGTGGAPGGKAWEEETGTGFKNLGAALRKLREAEQ